jgi:cyclopropane-fatty-acyl-phospholipid synthase
VSALPQCEIDASLRAREAQLEHERERVAEHYQHDPDIFRAVLGETRAYSVGVYTAEGDDLEAAQRKKLARVREKLDLRPGERVLDVGCGWGSIVADLAANTSAQIRGVTLSPKQREVALARAGAAGAADRVRIDVCHVDELDVADESLDAVVFSGSIVHMHDRASVHAKVGRWLKPGGRVLISDCYFPRQIRGDRDSRATHHIFVTALGYCRLIPLSAELSMMDDAGLDVCHVEDLTSSYVRTLDAWIDNVRTSRPFIDGRSPGFSRLLQTYMLVARTSFHRRTALEYMILGVKGRPRREPAAWPIGGG